jgi:hypothetical protein
MSTSCVRVVVNSAIELALGSLPRLRVLPWQARFAEVELIDAVLSAEEIGRRFNKLSQERKPRGPNAIP